MSDDDLLGDILASTQAAQAKAAVEEAIERKAERAARAREMDSPPAAEDEGDGIERTVRRYAADPRDNIMGLQVGARVTFVDSGEDLDGAWIVVKVEGAVEDGDERALVASRDGQSPPYVRIPEDVVREELGLGRLKLG